jgi:hypothetical protein
VAHSLCESASATKFLAIVARFASQMGGVGVGAPRAAGSEAAAAHYDVGDRPRPRAWQHRRAARAVRRHWRMARAARGELCMYNLFCLLYVLLLYVF